MGKEAPQCQTIRPPLEVDHHRLNTVIKNHSKRIETTSMTILIYSKKRIIRLL